jgi:hypothetical protein
MLSTALSGSSDGRWHLMKSDALAEFLKTFFMLSHSDVAYLGKLSFVGFKSFFDNFGAMRNLWNVIEQ